MAATLINDVIAGLDTSVMAEVNGSQLMQQVQELTVNLDRGFLFAKDDLPTVAEITANPLWKNYLAIRQIDNPKVIYGFDVTKFNAGTNPPWSSIGLLTGSITNNMLVGGIQLSKLTINPAIPADAGKFVVVNGAGNGYLHQALSLADNSIVLGKFSVAGGSPLYIIRIKEDSTGWEFVSPNDFMQSVGDNVILVSKLHSNGINPTGAGRFPKNPRGEEGFDLGNILAEDISTNGVAVGYQLISNGINAQWEPRVNNLYSLFQFHENPGVGAGVPPVLNDWFDAELNTTIINTTGAVLTTATGVITLLAGTYRIKAKYAGYQIGQHRLGLYNASLSSFFAQVGLNSFAANNAGSHWAEYTSQFTIGSTTNIKIRRICQATAADGLGIAANFAGLNEVFGQVELWKVA